MERLLAGSVLLVGGVLALGGCGRGGTGGGKDVPEISVYVAASLQDAVGEAAARYEAETGAELVVNWAGSGTLAQQILAARRADVFLSANAAWMDRVEAAGLVDTGTRRTLFSNTLVVVGHRKSGYPAGSPAALEEAVGLIAMGDPASVPAGAYAKAWLEGTPAAEGGVLWDKVRGRISPAADVRAVIAQVTGSREVLGIVYATDYAAYRSWLRLLYAVPVAEGPRILYVGAVLKGAAHPEVAAGFLDFLESGAGRGVLAGHGFTVPGGRGREGLARWRD